MARHFSQNVTLVTNYLAATTNSQSGATVEDIMSAAGISRATVYRVIKAHPAITQCMTTGKQTRYFLDAEALTKAALGKPISDKRNSADKRLRINVDAGLPKFLGNVGFLKFIEDVRPWVKPDSEGMTTIRKHFQNLSGAVENSWNFQSGTDNVDVEQIKAARQSIEALQTFCITVYLWLENLKAKPAYRSDEEFWTLFPKD